MPVDMPMSMPTLLPMAVQLLDAVVGIEVRAYPFPWSRANFVDSIAAGHLTHCLVAPDGELLGYQVAMAGFEEWHLLNVTISPDHQGRGLATQLLHRLIDHARSTGAEWLWLEVRPSNVRARRLYAHLGFAEIGVRRGYYPDAAGRREDALVLRLPLQPAVTAEDAAWT
ncbi:ribosomal protein S18-alanine N-acetyltransferase [Sphaerotilus sp.]|jgi:[ribosomal protein S18]-alanine N-acetyltransferase|uniref:ribosomal protein S18-alanine N-acetyltransferase n=1 Tax=Sphaerotilus sp. TaxID=2093942 RepID=UPI00286D87A1|nr:ribosomal protein S18-alanine N-acetyltransferase [Sphaerotilus sp.]